MNDTAITLTPDMHARLAAGYNARLNPAKNWDLPTLAGAGALRSTADDMLTFLAAFLGYADSPLASAMAAMFRERRSGPPTGDANIKVEVALGWMITTRGDSEIAWHNGGTGGYRSILAFDLKARAGVVALSNAGTVAGVDDIAMHLLNPAVALIKPPKKHTQISVDSSVYDTLIGRYEITPALVLVITRDADHLFVQATGQPRFELFPEGQRQFFLKVVDAVIIFDAEVNGHAPSLTLRRSSGDATAKRID
jgi:hypothetical protein